jgi:excisionase family DNA binding protein
MTSVDYHDTPAEHGPGPLRPLLVNISQAAEILSVSRTTLYQMMWRGDLTPIHIGRSVRFAVEQLEDFVNRRLCQRD